MFTIIIAQLTFPEHMTKAASEAIFGAERLYLQTARHPAAGLLAESAAYRSMDDLYETAEDFSALDQAVARRLTEEKTDAVYAVTGNILETQLPEIRRAAESLGGRVRVLPGVSLAALAFPGLDTGRVVTAHSWNGLMDPEEPITIEEMDSRILAGEIKRKLNEYFPDEWKILLARTDRSGAVQTRELPLYELDRQNGLDATCVVHVPKASFDELTRFGYKEFLDVMRRLRAPGGCPWDREQTHDSLKATLLEESYELLEAIDQKDDAHMTEELGDVLMQVAFHCLIAEEQGRFTDRDVTTTLVQKLVYRHPHVFGDVTAATSGEVLVNWEKLKKAEKGQRTQTDAINSVPKNLPALTRSRKVQKKVADVGFDWPDALSALPKVLEEAEELREAVEQGTNIYEECGDLLFATVNVVRLLKLDPEFALLDATNKFIRRFACMEESIYADGKCFEQMTLAEMDAYWDRAKKT